ncbi:MAG: hypothetical protein F6K58_16365 [Symploca sp. SIO2E9]|nr:hypothetical protein [Symploca sp. SIO2E9]
MQEINYPFDARNTTIQILLPEPSPHRVSEKKSGARSKQTLQTRRIQIPRKISFTPPYPLLDWIFFYLEVLKSHGAVTGS